MTVDLFAGLAVRDYQRALAWYERLLGSGPAFLPNAVEAVWELAELGPPDPGSPPIRPAIPLPASPGDGVR
jgi:hypothetical protein